MFHHRFTLPNLGTALLPLLYAPQDAVYPHSRVPLAWQLETHLHANRFLHAFLRRVGQKQHNFQGRADELGPIEPR